MSSHSALVSHRGSGAITINALFWFGFVLFCFVLRFTIYSILRLHILPSMWDQLILETSPTNSILYNVNENQCTAPEMYITEISF